MNIMMSDLNVEAAKMLILSLTLTCEAILREIRGARTEEARKAKIERFTGINGERVSLIQEHGLQTWAAGL